MDLTVIGRILGHRPPAPRETWKPHWRRLAEPLGKLRSEARALAESEARWLWETYEAHRLHQASLEEPRERDEADRRDPRSLLVQVAAVLESKGANEALTAVLPKLDAAGAKRACREAARQKHAGGDRTLAPDEREQNRKRARAALVELAGTKETDSYPTLAYGVLLDRRPDLAARVVVVREAWITSRRKRGEAEAQPEPARTAQPARAAPAPARPPKPAAPGVLRRRAPARPTRARRVARREEHR
jgi:hypothetical protein